MILGYRDLLKLWEKKQLCFDPEIDAEKQVGLSSIDLRLSALFTKHIVKPGYTFEPFAADFDPGPITQTTDLSEQQLLIGQKPGFLLKPNEFVLSRTLEKVRIPFSCAAQVQGTTTGARAGLSIHSTAPHVHPGFFGPIVLEIKNNGDWDLNLVPGQRICQLILFKIKTPVSRKEVSLMSSYYGQVQPYEKRRVGAKTVP